MAVAAFETVERSCSALNEKFRSGHVAAVRNELPTMYSEVMFEKLEQWKYGGRPCQCFYPISMSCCQL